MRGGRGGQLLRRVLTQHSSHFLDEAVRLTLALKGKNKDAEWQPWSESCVISQRLMGRNVPNSGTGKLRLRVESRSFSAALCFSPFLP